MGDKPRHRVWVFSLFACAALVVVPTAFISITWMLGIITDSSVPNVFDLFPFALIFSVPAAFVAFALLAPLAIATDRALRGRTTRPINIAFGAALGVTAFAVFFAGSALLRLPTPFTPRSIIAGGASVDTLYRVFAMPQTTAIVAMFAVSGMLVGLGLRHRGLLILAFCTLPATLAAQQAAPAFEVASVRWAESRTPSEAVIPRAYPGGRFRADVATVNDLVWFAYGIRQDLIVGGPEWVRQDRFEISAKANDDAPADQIKLMVRSLLHDRFKLVTHMERREMQVLALVRGRPDGPLGPNLISIAECSGAAVTELRRKFPEKYPMPGGGMTSACSSNGLGDLAVLLSIGQGTPVIDATGLTDSFYYIIRSQFSAAGALRGLTNNDPNLPALSTALEEQLGLKLQSRRGPVEVLVIDSAELPTPN